MKIGMILENNFPPDIRVEKETRSLTKTGHNIYLLCLRKENQPFEELIDSIFVRRIFNNQNLPFRKANRLFFYIRFYHRNWAKEIEKIVSEKKIEVLHVHDLPLVKTALTV